MAYALLPLVFGIMLHALIGLFSVVGNAAIEPPHADRAASQGFLFLAYRQAVTDFVTANPTASGTIPRSQLTLPAGMPVLPGEGNAVLVDSTGVTDVLAWAAITSAGLAAVVRVSQGDASLGYSTGGSWVSPVYGQMGALPTNVPSGNAVSFLQMHPE